ncbi:alpha/beta hydrolase [Mycobacterium sp. Y57]|uniref:alpha/beta fold hydrolase n=1 Tax=Mycolicibacterium xanthum TaxID=2796469 RepID=UPI001C863B04|nr:alpha/beta hydrolase [Mycolicibacterium xanthum]MBX7433959.1 alpha/beta hydrolase [Mycolicibacterium xanthum]
MGADPPPALDGVTHRFVDIGDGVTIHVAEAGPADGRPVLLVHGFPQHWWEWRHLIGPLAADGYRVLCPDLRGAGWSSAPKAEYRKTVMADDLAAVLDRLGVGPATLVAHDWGGPVAFIMMLRHPAKVAGFFGMNTIAPWLTPDLAMARHLWRFWYQIPIALPIGGPRLIGDRRRRFLRRLASWVGGDWSLSEEELQAYAERFRRRDRAAACSRWYRTFLAREFVPWLRGEYADARVGVPVRWLHGTADPVLTPTLLRGYADRIDDFQVEWVDGVGHWIAEQRPALVLDRLRDFLTTTGHAVGRRRTAGAGGELAAASG